jgi:hypothetical protein
MSLVAVTGASDPVPRAPRPAELGYEPLPSAASVADTYAWLRAH